MHDPSAITRLVSVLDADPDLGAGLTSGELERARRTVVAPVVSLPAGRWTPAAAFQLPADCMGLLVVNGLLTRELSVGGAATTELLGAEDLLVPWHDDPHCGLLRASWRVLVASEIAVLDRRAADAAAGFPRLMQVFVRRALRRQRTLSFQLAIHRLVRVEERLTALFWLFAERWGRVRPDGIFVPLPLRHDDLGRLVGARRPSVTTALGRLARRDMVARTAAGWLVQPEAETETRRLLRPPAGAHHPDSGAPAPAGDSIRPPHRSAEAVGPGTFQSR